MSIDSEGYGRIEKISFEEHKENSCLIEAVKRFKECIGHYLECVLADQIYRTSANRNYCKTHGIQLLGQKIDGPNANAKADKKTRVLG